MAEDTETPVVVEPVDGVEPVAPPTEPPVDLWRFDKNGKAYTPRPGQRGQVYRQGEETIADALERDTKSQGRAGDKKPRRKAKAPKLPPPTLKVDLKELEKELTEALRMPAMIAGMAGDEWAAEHFTKTAPYVSRNLIIASEHNPWLRRKLEEMASGQDAAMKLISMLNVGGALVLYLAPPIVYWFNLPVPDKGREMFGIPERKDRAASPPAQGFPAAA